jgi:hypothetical protein
MKNSEYTSELGLSIVKTNRNAEKHRHTTFNPPPFRVPDDFDPTELMNQLSKKNPSFAKQSAIPTALVSLAFVKTTTDHKNFTRRSIDGDEFAEISNKIFKGKISNLRKELKSVIEAMEEIGWIEVDHYYKVGHQSKGYRIGDRFLDSDWIEMPWEEALKNHCPELFELNSQGKETPLGKKKKAYLAQWNRACTILNPWEHMEDCRLKEVCRHTARILDDLSIPNYDQLIKQIESGVFCDSEEERKSKKQKLNRSNRKKKRRGSFFQKEDDSRPSLLRMVKAIRDKRFFVSCHDQRNLNFTNRLFTNWSSMKKEFRPYFRLKGRSLIGVDIKTCQAALLATFYSDSPEDLAEKDEFVKLVTELDIYEELAAWSAIVTGKQLARKEAKAKSFTLMFAKVDEEDRDIRAALQGMFPVLYRRMAELKCSENKWDEKYKRVSRALQSRESKIMIEGVLHELLIEKGIDCLSVHDSIYCTQEHIETVKDSITKWFSKEMGFVPQLEVEALEEPDLSLPISLIKSDSWWSDLKDSLAA